MLSSDLKHSESCWRNHLVQRSIQNKFLIIFMFFEFLIKKFFQSCSARIGFTPMHDAFVALSVANDLLDQVFVCQAWVRCIDWQHNILMSATNANKVSHFWTSQNTTLRTQLHLGVFLWKQYVIFAGYKEFCKLQSC